MAPLAARELAVAKKCSSSSSEGQFLQTSCPCGAAQPFVSAVPTSASDIPIFFLGALRVPCALSEGAGARLAPGSGLPAEFGAKAELGCAEAEFSPGMLSRVVSSPGVLRRGGLPSAGEVLQRCSAKVDSGFEAWFAALVFSRF